MRQYRSFIVGTDADADARVVCAAYGVGGAGVTVGSDVSAGSTWGRLSPGCRLSR